MRKHYLLLLICATTVLTQFAYGQENKSISEKGLPGKKQPVKNNISAYLSGGNMVASGKMKDSAFIGNGWNVETGAYFPLISVGRIKSHSNSTKSRMYNRESVTNGSSFGIEAGLNYASQKADGSSSAYTNAVHLQDGTIAPAFEGSTPRANSFQIFAGPKAEWNLGKVSVAPSVLLGYFSLSRNGYTLSGTVINPKQTTESKEVPFITAKNYSTSGFVVKPGVELGYHFYGRVAVFAKGALSFGHSIQNNIAFWKPQGKASEGNSYSYDQFANGAAKATSFSSRWQAASVNIGIRYTWIKSAFDKGRRNASGRLSMTPTTTKQTQGMNFGEKVASGLQTGANAKAVNDSSKGGITKPGGAVSSSYAAGRLSMTPTTTKQTQGMAANKGSNPLYQGGTASGDNPMYEGNKISGDNPLYEGNNTSGVNPMYDPAKLSRPGNPIGGIIVKGGKNPGPNSITIVSNNNGEVFLNNLEAGNYLFQLNLPEQPAGKSINEKGVKRSDNSEQLTTGQSIPGVIVKGGKSSGGNFIPLTVDKNGQISFEVLEAGNYKLILSAPDANNPATKNAKKARKKITEKASSGLKDTLKTNV